MNNQKNVPTFRKESIRAIIGLGNPGNKFIKTRHNIGFRIVERMAEQYNAPWQTRENLDYCSIQTSTHPHTILLIKPTTFMNESGRVASFLLKKGIKPEEILVAHDELEKKFGSLLVSHGGSPRGHNGIKSLQAQLGASFWRLRFGIDRPVAHDPEAVGEYVLGLFSLQEEALMESCIEKAVALVL